MASRVPNAVAKLRDHDGAEWVLSPADQEALAELLETIDAVNGAEVRDLTGRHMTRTGRLAEAFAAGLLGPEEAR